MAPLPSRPLRRVQPGSTWEITTRTLQSRFLLLPTRACRERILGVLGRALELYPGIQLHAFVFLANHYHLIVTAPDGETLSGFMCFLDSNVARKIGKLFGWFGRFWGRRYRSIEILDAEAMESRLEYLLSQGVKEGLVRRPMDWPGASCLRGLRDGRPIRGTWIDETGLWWARRRGDAVDSKDFEVSVTIPLSPLPCWQHLSEIERQGRVREIEKRIEADAPEKVLGVSAILRQSPSDRPASSARSKAPLCHSSTLDAWKRYRDDFRELAFRYRVASVRLRGGQTSAWAEFPPFFFPPPLTISAHERLAHDAKTR